MKAKFLRVVAVLAIVAASGLANYPMDLLPSMKCC